MLLFHGKYDTYTLYNTLYVMLKYFIVSCLHCTIAAKEVTIYLIFFCLLAEEFNKIIYYCHLLLPIEFFKNKNKLPKIFYYDAIQIVCSANTCALKSTFSRSINSFETLNNFG